MKSNIDKSSPKAEDNDASNRRRESYALKRDKQASEQNEAITRRLLSEARNLVKCEKCGKEFSARTDSETPLVCPDCS